MNVEPMPTGVARARAIRSSRARRLMLRLAMFAGVPTLLAALYYGFLASDQYQSISVVTIEAADDKFSGNVGVLFGALPSSGTARDVLLVRDYIESRDMLAHLVAEHGWLEHMTDPHIDWWSRLSADASSEDIYEDYLERIQVVHDTSSNTLSLAVRAYSARKASAFAQAILAASEEMVNEMADRVRMDRMRFAQGELDKAEQRYAKAAEALLALQDQGVEIDPAGSASVLMGVRAELEAELAKARAELDTVRAVMRPDAPKVRALQQRVQSLRRQVDAQRRRLVDKTDDDGLNQQIARFEPAMMEKEFAQQALASAAKALELARVDASRQHRYMVTISSPSQPDEPTHPRRGWSVLTVLVLALLATGIGSILVASIREHAKL